MTKTTRKQREALYLKWTQAPQGLTYREFRKTAQPTIGCDDAILVPWCGMWLGIETNGYCHS